MTKRKPQINFVCEPHLKMLYDQANRYEGLDATRMCAAGFLYLIEHPDLRARAVARLAHFESSEATPRTDVEVRQFLKDATAKAGSDSGSVKVPTAPEVLERTAQTIETALRKPRKGKPTPPKRR